MLPALVPLALVAAIVRVPLPSAAATERDAPSFVRQLLDAAVAQTSHRVVYDGSYRRIPYPGGDATSPTSAS